MIEIVSGERLDILDQDGDRIAIMISDPGIDALLINGHAISREDVDGFLKALHNWRRTGFFDGRVRT